MIFVLETQGYKALIDNEHQESAKIVIITCPGPISFAKEIAPATLIADDPPRQRPSFF